MLPLEHLRSEVSEQRVIVLFFVGKQNYRKCPYRNLHTRHTVQTWLQGTTIYFWPMKKMISGQNLMRRRAAN